MKAGANCAARLLTLNRDTFDRILGSIKQYLKEDYTDSSVPGSINSRPKMIKKESCTKVKINGRNHNIGTLVGVDGAFVFSSTEEENADNSQMQIGELEASAVSSSAQNPLNISQKLNSSALSDQKILYGI